LPSKAKARIVGILKVCFTKREFYGGKATYLVCEYVPSLRLGAFGKLEYECSQKAKARSERESNKEKKRGEGN